MIIRSRLQYDRDHDLWRWTYCDDWSRFYCTDLDGRGVYYVDDVKETTERLASETDFSTAGLPDTAAKAKIRKWMKERH